MSLIINELRRDWNPDVIYDITGIKEIDKWEYCFTKVFPEHVFTTCFVGRFNPDSREGSRLLFMQSTDERFKTFRLYWDLFVFRFKDGVIQMFICSSITGATRINIENRHLAGKEWLEAVYGVPDEKGEVAVTFVPKMFEELVLVMAREFTDDELKAIENVTIQKLIDEKTKEIEELKIRKG